MLESLVGDIRFSLRWLRRSPGFALVAIASLAIGIGFNAALFAIVDALLFRPLPVADPGSLVNVYTTAPGQSAAEHFGTTSYPDYLDLKAENAVFADMIGYSPMFAALNLGDRSRLAMGEIVTGNYFQMLGIKAAVGRTLLPEDDRSDAPRAAMISFAYWTRELAGSPSIVGTSVKLRGNLYSIVGVAPRGFTGLTSALAPEVWVPVAAAMEVEPVGLHDVVPSPTGTNRLDRRGDRWLFVKGRLKPGITIDRAHANLDVLMARLVAANPITNKDRRIDVRSSNDVHFHPAADPLLVPIALGLMLVVGLVLLIACANVASMLLARASARQKEIGIRLAIGASRARLVRQLLTESLVLSSAGAIGGVGLAWMLTRAVGALPLPIPIPLAFDIRMDRRALFFTTAVTIAAGVFAGLFPAARASKPNLVADLRGEAPLTAVGRRRWTLRDWLVAAQMAITALLLVVAALLTRSLAAARNASIGFQAEHLALVSMDTGMLRYSPERGEQFYREALARLRAWPGVESVALATRLPFSVNANRWAIWVPGHHRIDQAGDTIDVTRVSADYFATIGVPIVQGRAFTEADQPHTPAVAVINETMARRYWPGENPIGKTFRSRVADGQPFEVVGVSADHKVMTIGEPPTPLIHFARNQQPNSYSCIVARTHGDAGALLRDMRRELLSLDPNIVFVENQTMEGVVQATLFPARASAWLVSGVGLVAMGLAAVGLYGVIAYSVARRTREIGIRMALGARPMSVLRLVMTQGLFVAATGLAAGCLLAAAASRLLSGALYGVSIGDPISWTSASAILIAVSALANLVPAWRAARIAPSQALRTE